MKKVFLGLLTLTIISLLALGCGAGQTPPPPQNTELNISAAVSLKDALGEIQKNYLVKKPNVKLIFNLGASGTLQKQIQEGAPADIFISAAAKQMDELAAKNLIVTGSRKNLVENELVIIVPQNSQLQIAGFKDLLDPAVGKIGIGEPRVVPAGQYAMEVFEKVGIWDRLKEKAVMAKDVRTVLAYVETGNVEAGVVYKTDATGNGKVKITAEAPAGSHKPIVYPAAVLTGAKNSKEAQEFLDYLSGPESRAVFEKYGFLPPAGR